MKKQIHELADRYTILRLKKLHGLKVDKEFKIVSKLVKKVDKNLLSQLFDANMNVWNYEAQVGKLALIIRGYNNKRNDIKNKIAEKYGGFIDKKKY